VELTCIFYTRKMYAVNTVTINVTMPKGLIETAKQLVAAGWYTSVSEVLRSGVRQLAAGRQQLTINGFTPEFEEEVLRAAAEPVDKSLAWDGKGSFVTSVLSKGKRRKKSGRLA